MTNDFDLTTNCGKLPSQQVKPISTSKAKTNGKGLDTIGEFSQVDNPRTADTLSSNTTLQDYYKGCGKKLFISYSHLHHCGQSCGCHEFPFLCSECQAKILGYKQARQEELEFLEYFYKRNMDTLVDFGRTKDEADKWYNKGVDDVCKAQREVILKRIKQIEQELSGGKE